MSRFFIELSYKGTAYNGWQRQPGAPSVQQTLEEALSTLHGEPVELTGAGRTDTGVHALFAVAHFDTSKGIPPSSEDEFGGDDAAYFKALNDPKTITSPQFLYHLNSILPYDIAVRRIYQVNDNRHARFDARRREYKYYITTVKEPFRSETTWQITTPLNLDAMRTAAISLMRYEDFTSFAKLHSDNKTNLCTIYGANWHAEGHMLVFTIAANRFLRGMVRAIVGTLVDVGRGKMSPGQFCNIIESLERAEASAQAPAQGLFLSDIQY